MPPEVTCCVGCRTTEPKGSKTVEVGAALCAGAGFCNPALAKAWLVEGAGEALPEVSVDRPKRSLLDGKALLAMLALALRETAGALVLMKSKPEAEGCGLLLPALKLSKASKPPAGGAAKGSAAPSLQIKSNPEVSLEAGAGGGRVATLAAGGQGASSIPSKRRSAVAAWAATRRGVGTPLPARSSELPNGLVLLKGSAPEALLARELGTGLELPLCALGRLGSLPLDALRVAEGGAL
jgi:hypothetical protein